MKNILRNIKISYPTFLGENVDDVGNVVRLLVFAINSAEYLAISRY